MLSTGAAFCGWEPVGCRAPALVAAIPGGAQHFCRGDPRHAAAQYIV